MRARTSRTGIRLFIAWLRAWRTGRNYQALDHPRYAGEPDASFRDSAGTDTLRVVSFNIAFGREVDRAIELFKSEPPLGAADVVLLQEMDGEGTRRIATALGMRYVYYPAINHSRTRRDFGNAVLSRWPIVEDDKLVLPHRSRYAGTQRTATAATIRVGESSIRVYSTHLSTLLDAGEAARRDQLRAIVDDAKGHSRVVIGGDMNSASVGRVAQNEGFLWPTARGPSTTHGLRWDHFFFKGLESPSAAAIGTVPKRRGVSDHRPVWAVALIR